MDYLVKDNNLKNKKFLIIISIITTLIILMGSVYAFFTYHKSVDAFTLTSSGISATFTSGTNQINFTNAYPISDSFALENLSKLDYIDFMVSGSASNPNEAVTYEIFLTEANGNTLSNNYIKTYVTDEDGVPVKQPAIYGNLPRTTYANEPTGRIVLKKTYADTFTKSYRLYVWLDQDYTQNDISQTFSFYVNIYAYNNTRSNISNTITITYNPMGGQVNPTSEEIDEGAVYENLPTPTKEGYNFDGWYLEDTYENKVIPDVTPLPDNNRVTLYAKWTLDSISNVNSVE